MSDIIVDTYKLRDYAQKLEAVNRKITDVDEELNDLYFKINLADLLNIIISDIYTESSSKLLSCVAYLKQTAADFESAEDYIRNPTGASWKSVSVVPTPKSGSSTIKSAFSKFVGGFGLTGTVVSWAINSDNPEKSFSSLLKAVGKGVKVGSNMLEGKVVDLLGWGKTVDAIGFRENLAFELDKYKINNAYNSANTTVIQKNASNLSAVCSWMAVAVKGMINFKNNADEFNYDFKNTRMWAETITETAIDVGMGILIGAGVAAIAGASAPVWAVGLIATGTGMLLDMGSKAILGKGLTEAISDFTLDVGEKAVKVAAAATKEVGKAVKKAAEATGKAVATAGKVVAATAKTVGNAVKKTGQAVAKNVEKAGKAVVNTVSKTVAKATTAAKNIATNAVKKVGNTVKAVKNTAAAAWKSVTNIGKGLSSLFA